MLIRLITRNFIPPNGPKERKSKRRSVLVPMLIAIGISVVSAQDETIGVGRFQFIRFGAETPGPSESSVFAKFDTITGRMWVYDKTNTKLSDGTIIQTKRWNEVKDSGIRFNLETGESKEFINGKWVPVSDAQK